MSIYDRAQRQSLPLCGSTPGMVGPGTYDTHQPELIGNQAGYAPFHSLANRDSSWSHDPGLVTPGPGAYDPNLFPSKIPGGSSMQAAVTRFAPVEDDIPGPGSYNVLHRDIIKSMSLQNVKQKSDSHVKYYRKPEAPSIPIPSQAYGFEESEDGSLMKQDPPKRDVTLGPAFYRPKYNLSQYHTVKSMDFGRRSDRMGLFTNTDTPGPGTYGVIASDAKFLMQKINVNIHESNQLRFESRIPRFSDATTLNAYKQGIPGPGRYDIKTTLKVDDDKYNTDGFQVDRPPFMSQTMRFKSMRDEGPGPTSYNDPRHALEGLHRVSGLKKSPFGQTSVRFNRLRASSMPGPGSYNFYGIGAESLRKAYLDSTQKGVFGTTSARTMKLARNDDSQLPGPAQYRIKDTSQCSKNKFQPLTANFVSASKRISEPAEAITDLPGPAAYHLQQAYENSQIKSKRAQPRTREANCKQHSFLVGSSRFAPSKISPWRDVDPDNPGPNSYNPRLNQHIPSVFMPKSDRFQFKDNDMPGPGSYDIPVSHRDTVLKGTFNAALSNPLRVDIMESPKPVCV